MVASYEVQDVSLLDEVRTVTLNNKDLRVDVAGNIMDVHDGNVIIIDGIYYWYGAAYGDCKEPAGPTGCANATVGACGFALNHNVSLYTSPDLGNWTFQGHVFSATQYPQPSIMFCPKVIYNAATKMYVMWTNWINKGNFAESYYATAVSSSPLGPFKVVVDIVSTGYNNTGDFNLFVDQSGDAYIIYTAHIAGFDITHRMSIEKLTADYLGTEGLTASSGFFGASFVEAPALFSANGLYYAVFGQCCCYCQSGSPVTVYTSSNVLGPYTGSANPITSAINAQQTNIFGYLTAPGKYAFIWQGDRWQSAPDGIKGHDFLYMGPIVFNGTFIEALPFDDTVSIDVYVQ